MNPLFLLYRGVVFCGMKDRREKNTDGENQYKKMLLLMLLRILWKHADTTSGPIDYRKVRDYHGEP